MILYALACEEGHRFESWFRDSAAYDAQSARDDVACPTCGSTRIAKTIMAPAVRGERRPAQDDQAPVGDRAPIDVALLDERSRELRALLKSVRDKVVAEGHDVGAKFAGEARRMHDGEIPHRQIYGQATVGEARDLLDEGIMVLPLPSVPDELN